MNIPTHGEKEKRPREKGSTRRRRVEEQEQAIIGQQT